MKYKKTVTKVVANYPKPHMKDVDCYIVLAPKWKPLELCVHRELDYMGGQTKMWVMSEMSTGLKLSKDAWVSRELAVLDGIGRMKKVGYDNVIGGMERSRQEVKDILMKAKL